LDCVQAFAGPDQREAESLAFGLWLLVHGAALLGKAHLKEFEPVIDQQLVANVEVLLDGWKQKQAANDAAPQRQLLRPRPRDLERDAVPIA
jgi:hypothetical protein